MEDEQTKKLIEIIIKYMKSHNEDFNGAVNLVSEYSRKNGSSLFCVGNLHLATQCLSGIYKI